MQLAGGAVLVMALAFLFIGQSAWARYQVYRWEVFGSHWGLTATSREETELALVEALENDPVGSWLCHDGEMLAHLCVKRGHLFARQPDAARLALASLFDSTLSISEMLSQEECGEFLLYALAGETNVNPEDRNFSSDQATRLLRLKTESLDSITDEELEALCFCVANSPTLVERSHRLKIRSAWVRRVPQLQRLVAEGIDLGETLCKSLTDPPSESIQVAVEEGYTVPVRATRDRVTVVLMRSLATLIGLSSDIPIEFIRSDAADANLVLKINGEVLSQYQSQVIEWRKTYERGGIRVGFGRNRYYRLGRYRDEAVATGKTRTEYDYGATVELQVPLAKPSIEIDPTLVYWADYVRGQDRAKLDPMSVKYEELSGRVWPLGIHKSYFLSGVEELDAD